MKYFKVVAALFVLAIASGSCTKQTALEKATPWDVSGITPITVSSELVPGSEYLIYVVSEGTGRLPFHGDYMCFQANGFTADFTAFYTTIDASEQCYQADTRSTPIIGLEEALMKMKKGGKYRFVFPPEMAYGNENYAYNGAVAPGSKVIYDIELTSIY